MKKHGLGIFLLMISTCFVFSGEKIWKKLEIEFHTGLSIINPADLNLWADYNKKTDKFLNADFFDYQESLFGNFTYTKRKSGNIPAIKNAFLIGLRLKLKINDHDCNKYL